MAGCWRAAFTCLNAEDPRARSRVPLPGLFIDARYKGNIARLLNSSCDPNCETQKWHDSATGEARIGIFARRDIRPGEELTYDYFFEHYGPFAPPAASFQCMCGAKNCRCATVALSPPGGLRRGRDRYQQRQTWLGADHQL